MNGPNGGVTDFTPDFFSGVPGLIPASFVAGDLADASPDRARPARAFIQGLTKITTVDASTFVEAAAEPERYFDLACALERMDEESAVFTLNHVIHLGKLTAYERLAHLIMELRYRFAHIRADAWDSMPFPLTQETLGDALGLSTVHIHRTMKQLRNDGLVTVKGGMAYIQDEDGLAAVSQFSPPRPFAIK